jgi:tetratricopeptide (TPR) repeat protein
MDAARRLGDRDAQARAHRFLGFAYADLGRFHDAHLHLRRALELSGEIGDPAGQAWTHHYRDLVDGLQGRDADALDAAQRALRLFEAAGDPDAARDAWQEARAILGEFDPSAADQVRTRIHRFD